MKRRQPNCDGEFNSMVNFRERERERIERDYLEETKQIRKTQKV